MKYCEHCNGCGCGDCPPVSRGIARLIVGQVCGAVTQLTPQGESKGYTSAVSRRIVFALVLVGALWQGPAWAYLTVAGVTGTQNADGGYCSRVSVSAQNGCCGGSCAPACQSACGFLGAAAIPLGPPASSSFAAAFSQPIAFGRTAIVSFDSAPPIRPPIP